MCRTGCPTPGEHGSWGECARAAAFQIDQHSLRNDLRLERRKDAHLERYRQLRADGHEPGSIKKSNLDKFEAANGLG